ncbi:MAG: hypothetical protein FWF50_00090 [Defluviitaleaceae bacterium]|nr:hypothetical protein [Defluviitaleaceae bacterium]
MFKFFNKKNNLEIDVCFLKKMLVLILEKSENDFSIFLKQIKEDIIIGIFPVPKYMDNYISISFQKEVLKKYEKTNEKSFSLENIRIFDINLNRYVSIEIFFDRGLLIGINSDVKLNKSTLDLNNITTKFSQQKETTIPKEIKEKISNLQINDYNHNEIFEINIGNRKMIHLKELSDGDFLAVEENSFYDNDFIDWNYGIKEWKKYDSFKKFERAKKDTVSILIFSSDNHHICYGNPIFNTVEKEVDKNKIGKVELTLYFYDKPSFDFCLNFFKSIVEKEIFHYGYIYDIVEKDIYNHGVTVNGDNVDIENKKIFNIENGYIKDIYFYNL